MNAEPNRQFARITDEALETLRARINVPIENTAEPWCYEATRDNIRHYAHGIGDDNPLWCDPDYAAKSSHGGIIALPSFLFATSRIQPDAQFMMWCGGCEAKQLQHISTQDAGGWKSKRLMMDTYVHGDRSREVIDKVFGDNRTRKRHNDA